MYRSAAAAARAAAGSAGFFFAVRRSPLGILAGIGDGPGRATVAAAVAVINTGFGIFNDGRRGLCGIVDTVRALFDAGSAFPADEIINDRIPCF